MTEGSEVENGVEVGKRNLCSETAGGGGVRLELSMYSADGRRWWILLEPNCRRPPQLSVRWSEVVRGDIVPLLETKRGIVG